MRKVDSLHKLPERKRKRIAFCVAGGSTIVIFLVWLSVFGLQAFDPVDPQEQNQKGLLASIVDDITLLLPSLSGESEFSVENNFVSVDDADTIELGETFKAFEKDLYSKSEDDTVSYGSPTYDVFEGEEIATTTATTST